MTWVRSSRGKLLLAFALELLLLVSFATWVKLPSALAQGIPVRWEAKRFQPPDGIGVPSRREGAASRGTCLTNGRSLTALMPIDAFGVTVDAYPTLLFYLPATQAGTAPPVVTFKLEDKTEQYVYTTTFNTVGKSGIISISLPAFAGLAPLEVGKDYQWIFSINCNPQNRNSSENTFVSGQIRRVPLDVTLYGQLRQKSSLAERANLYAGAEIWHNALIASAELQRSHPKEPSLAVEWEKLLQSVQLEAIANEPFIELE